MTDTLYLQSDKKIIAPEEDTLGYKTFSDNFAKSIVQYSSKDSMVFGLEAEWGSGKSTILGWMKNYIQEHDKDIIVVEFNPWVFSSHTDLIDIFLAEVSQSLEGDLGKKFTAFKVAYHKLDQYLSVKNLLKISAECYIPGSSLIVSILEKLKLKKPTKSVIQQKEEVNKALKDKRVVVFIDDVDRLTPDEILSVFKLLKAVCDFDNMHYVLAYDRSYVVNALENTFKDKAEDYLKKIVQVPKVLPYPDSQGMNQLFFKGLSPMLLSPIFEENDEHRHKRYWTNVYYDGVKPYLKTPRDIIRLLNSFSLTYAGLKGEVSWPELVYVEVLKINNRVLFETIAQNKLFFTGYFSDHQHYGGKEREEFSEALHIILDSTNNKKNPKTLDALRIIFPKVKTCHKSMYSGQTEQYLKRKDRSICTEEYFDLYFMSELPNFVLGKALMDKFASIASYADKDSISNFIRQCLLDFLSFDNSREVREKFLESLLDYAKDPAIKQNAVNVIHALIATGKSLAPYRHSSDLINPQNKLERVIIDLLYTLPNAELITQTLKDAFHLGNYSIYILCETVWTVLRDSEKGRLESYEENKTLSAANIKCLIELAVLNIEEKAEVNQESLLSENPRLLYLWAEWAEASDSISRWFVNISKNKESLLQLMRMLAFRISRTSEDTTTDYYYTRYENIEKFIDPMLVRDAIFALSDDLQVKNDEKLKLSIPVLLDDYNNPNLRLIDINERLNTIQGIKR